MSAEVPAQAVIPQAQRLLTAPISQICDEAVRTERKEMARPTIERIELHKHLFLNDFCAEVFITGEQQPVARIDGNKLRFKSTLATRLAGVDSLLMGVTLEKLTNHPMTVINPNQASA